MKAYITKLKSSDNVQYRNKIYHFVACSDGRHIP